MQPIQHLDCLSGGRAQREKIGEDSGFIPTSHTHTARAIMCRGIHDNEDNEIIFITRYVSI